MKKVLCAILAAATLLLCACGGTAAPEQTPAVTPAPTAAPTPKTDRNGFDEASNTELSFGGLIFQIPSYYDEPEYNDNGIGTLYLEESGDVVGGIIICQYMGLNTGSSDAELRTAEYKLADMLAEKLGAEVGTQEETTLCGYIALKTELYSDVRGNERMVLYGTPESESISIITFFYPRNAKYDYAPDFERILESAKNNDAVEETSADGVTPEFKAKMDSLEAFFDEYVDFMNTYLNAASSGDVMGMLSKYMNFLSKYADAMSELEDIDEVNLSAADYAYYVEVYGRIMQKLLKVVG